MQIRGESVGLQSYITIIPAFTEEINEEIGCTYKADFLIDRFSRLWLLLAVSKGLAMVTQLICLT